MKECVQEYAGMDVREIVNILKALPRQRKFPLRR